MNNFKSGSGNLDFGAESNEETEDAEDVVDENESQGVDPAPERVEASGETDSEDSEPADDSDQTETSEDTEYPYFVRRSNVGDERDTRLEIHVRDSVAEQEGRFRSELADALDVSEVSKTDAREFALLAAYEHPEKVAKLMEAEGFGVI